MDGAFEPVNGQAGPAIDEQKQINANLAAMIAKHDATLDNHDARLAFAEETLRQVMMTQQGIKDILGRLNGHN